MVGHLSRLPYADLIPADVPVGLLARGFYNNLISGPAAVIAFFVISGFCIHFPYRNADRVALLPYFARRHIRILTPVVAALALAHFLGLSLTGLSDSILWSLVCEEIYYTIYPVLLRLRVRLGWPLLIASSFVAALGVAATDPGAGNYPSYGWQLNWVLGLPCWILGCHLAQGWDSLRATARQVTTASIWRWRLIAWGASILCSTLRFHSPLTYPWTLNLFAFVVVLWLEREVARGLSHQPSRLLEWAGGASYSIYLVHPHGQRVIRDIWGVETSSVAAWLLVNAAVLALCYVFYRLVERPSHALARYTYGAMMRSRAAASFGALQPDPHLAPSTALGGPRGDGSEPRVAVAANVGSATTSEGVPQAIEPPRRPGRPQA
jgi:peptidoglycan/LPS O-acetylase OafA/YrhL